ncbi:hypothetical protein GQ53DRAFT_784625 [Thozetella sp. PMI_491]|nr:hypothetical protein GQ53DRAFT_784625 [Thozetella sp. PMI_491]
MAASGTSSNSPSDGPTPAVVSPTSTSATPESASPTAFQFPAGFQRRTHKKSRAGCAVCKKRKIKCDERHPSCLNCILHGVECPFKSQAPAPKPNVNTAGEPAGPVSLTKELPLVELELLHNYTANTCLTLSNNPRVEYFWRVTVVECGLRSDYTMRAILAVSALHLAHNDAERRDFFISQGLQYHQQALKSAMQLMEMPRGEDTKISLFMFSMLTIFFAVTDMDIALGSPRGPNGYLFAGDPGFPDWAFLLRGSKLLGSKISESDRGRNTPVEDFLAYGWERWAARANRPNMVQEKPRAFEQLRQNILSRVQNEELLATYNTAIDELEVSLLATQDESTPRDIIEAMMWLWAVSDTLIPLLKVPVQEVVVIFAHFSIILKHYESQWWLQGWSEYLVTRCYGILDEEHRPWIAWPMQEMGFSPHPPSPF